LINCGTVAKKTLYPSLQALIPRPIDRWVAIKGNVYCSDPYISLDSYNYCIAISVPIKKQEEVVGVLMGDLNIQ